MRAALDNHIAIQYQDLISVNDSGQPMRNHEHCAPIRQVNEIAHDRASLQLSSELVASSHTKILGRFDKFGNVRGLILARALHASGSRIDAYFQLTQSPGLALTAIEARAGSSHTVRYATTCVRGGR